MSKKKPTHGTTVFVGSGPYTGMQGRVVAPPKNAVLVGHTDRGRRMLTVVSTDHLQWLDKVET